MVVLQLLLLLLLLLLHLAMHLAKEVCRHLFYSQHIGYGCNRSLGCPGHFPGVLEPLNASLPAGYNRLQVHTYP